MSDKDLDVSNQLKSVLTSTQTQSGNLLQLQNLVLDLQKELKSCKDTSLTSLEQQKRDLAVLSQDLKNIASSITINTKDIESIPGVRTPKWYNVLIPFGVESENALQNSIEINPEGPFVITQISAFWEILDVDAGDFQEKSTFGRIVPCSAYPMILNSFGVTNNETTFPGIIPGYNTPSFSQLFATNSAANKTGVLSYIPEFDFQIEVAGTGRFFTSQPIPAAALYGYGDSPLYTGVQGWAERGDKIVIYATPLVPTPTYGRVHFCIHGYQILGPVSITQALGYTES